MTYTVTQNVLKSHHYKCEVTAINAIGESLRSPKLQSFIAIVPSVPLNFEFVLSNSGTIEVSWDAPEHDGGATLLGYYIYDK